MSKREGGCKKLIDSHVHKNTHDEVGATSSEAMMAVDERVFFGVGIKATELEGDADKIDQGNV